MTYLPRDLIKKQHEKKQIARERKQAKQQKQEEDLCLVRGSIICVRQEIRVSGK